MNRFHCIFLTAAMLFLATGCEKTQTPIVDAVASTDNEHSVIVDRLNREIPIDSPAQRIVSLSPATTELLFALDLGDQVVGATKHCNYPPRALDLPRVGGGTIESINSETIVSLKPDLVLCKWDTHQPLLQTFDRLSIPVCSIGAQSLEELYEEARWIGRLTDRRQQAEDLIRRMKSQHAELLAVVAKHRQDPPLRVFYEVWDEPLMTAAPNSFIGELLTMAGLENILSDTTVRYPRISSESVVQGDPDLILAPTSHFENVEVDSFRSRPGWSELNAVVNERIYLISGDQVSRCGPRVLDALAEIVLAAYPDAVDDVDAPSVAPEVSQ